MKTIYVNEPSRLGDKTYSKHELEYIMARGVADPGSMAQYTDTEIDFEQSTRKSVDAERVLEIVFMMAQGQPPVEEVN